MYGTGFPEKAGTEFLEKAIGVHQYPMKLLHLALFIRRMMIVNIVRSRVIKFRRGSFYFQFDSEHPERCHVFLIKVRNGTRVKTDDVFLPIAHPDNQTVTNEIEIDDKRAAAVWDGGSRQTDGRYVEGNIPPVILPA